MGDNEKQFAELMEIAESKTALKGFTSLTEWAEASKEAKEMSEDAFRAVLGLCDLKSRIEKNLSAISEPNDIKTARQLLQFINTKSQVVKMGSSVDSSKNIFEPDDSKSSDEQMQNVGSQKEQSLDQHGFTGQMNLPDGCFR